MLNQVSWHALRPISTSLELASRVQVAFYNINGRGTISATYRISAEDKLMIED